MELHRCALAWRKSGAGGCAGRGREIYREHVNVWARAATSTFTREYVSHQDSISFGAMQMFLQDARWRRQDYLDSIDFI
jgi:hypothetical protein